MNAVEAFREVLGNPIFAKDIEGAKRRGKFAGRELKPFTANAKSSASYFLGTETVMLR